MRSQLPLLLSDCKRRGTIGPKNGGGQNAPAKENAHSTNQLQRQGNQPIPSIAGVVQTAPTLE